jgi:Zn-dependent peptidase ImmA (M78 family)/transcriptional regulator with XRE-family HTH domain
MEPDITVSRVRETIERTGLSQAAFAERVGMDADKLSKSLKSIRRFTSLELANIAELASVTVEWLLGRERPLPSLAARADDTSAAVQAVAVARRYAEARADLASLGYPQTVQPLVPTRRPGRLIDQGAELAHEALSHVPEYVNSPMKVDLPDLIEESFGIDVVVQNLSCDGLAWSDAASRLIVVGTSTTPTRQRFSMAHELGHILSNDDQKLTVDKDVMDPTDRRKPSEMRANAFAAAFLMPEETVRSAVGNCTESSEKLSDIDFSSIVMRLAVSPSALSYRMSNLGMIGQTQRDHFGHLNTAQCANLAGQVETYVEWASNSAKERIPIALLSQMLAAYLDHKTTLRPLANVLGVSVDQLRQGLEPMLGAAEDADKEGPVFAP